MKKKKKLPKVDKLQNIRPLKELKHFQERAGKASLKTSGMPGIKKSRE